MSAQEEFHDPTEGHGGSSIALFLALYLLVLAFFILLVSISTVEEVKSQAAMDSLSSTFTTILPPSLQLTAVSGSDGEVLAGQQFQQEVTQIFSTTIQVTKVDVIQPGRLMRVKLNSDILFETDKADIRPSNQPLLDRIVASLSSRPTGFRYDMEFIIGTAYAVGKSLPIGETLEIARAGVFAREMLGRGAPPDSVAIGIKHGDPKEISIWFYIRDIDEAQLKFIETKNGEKN
ncbi:MAG: hypothetical protein HQ504_07905 [Rhodospirillaceae bacterium]|nr:hypothetical protein [Rhodospirillaceae bacterium]